MLSLTVKAPAKINLCLKLIGERSDGYTDIWSVVQTVSLFDEIDIEKKESGLSLSSNDSSIPLNESNTVAKAWAVMCQVVGTELGAKIHIGKRIPPQSGLGGGSSDAAAVLIGLCKL
ncbi:MAG TPA: 4-(cytidine 5'-diphospho)-2-C-methyl-D-erythritol kinase, partial [candidate division Zixibacteria bacterium]|nr:4-(cytidine 5'-diphospho)-2-C-methyl-D-erythritol kinase [candidate division Zixibacteria bacterium]